MLNTNYDLVCRGKVSVKGKGEMLTYFLEGKVQGVGTATTSSVMRSVSLARRIHSCGKASVQTNLESVSSMASLTVHSTIGGSSGQLPSFVAGGNSSSSSSPGPARGLPATCVSVVDEGEEEEAPGRESSDGVGARGVVVEMVGDGAV